MTRAAFMKELASRLKYLPKEDLQAALQYYEEYFDEAGADGEQTVIAELKSPRHVAAKILSDYAVKEAKTARASTTSGWRVFWFTILAICAVPVAVPLIIAAVVTVIALGIAGIAVVIALVAAAGFAFIQGFSLLFYGSAAGLMLFGWALVLMGCALFVFYGVTAVISAVGKHIKNKSNT
ncbi:MAG: DUF1700 domain-containing protein [Treponema sp.]